MAAFTQLAPSVFALRLQPRKLILVRHSKSAYPSGVADFDRPLNERGQRDALALAEYLTRLISGDATVMVSAANRTRQTWAHVSKSVAITGDAVFERRIYEADREALIEVIREAKNEVRELVMIGHSPGLEELGLFLSSGNGDAKLQGEVAEKFPTSGVLVLEVSEEWSNLEIGVAELVGFHVPRNGTKPITNRQSLK